MAFYDVPKVFYQTSLDASTAVEIRRFKSFVWNNKSNNQGNFTLTLPIDELLPMEPQFDHYIRIGPGDVIMKVERRKKICDEKDNLWWELGGRPEQFSNDEIRDSQNYRRFRRYVYDGIGDISEQILEVGNSVATIGTSDIISSNFYEDNLGGYMEEITPEYTWGTTIESKEIVNIAKEEMVADGWYQIPGDAMGNWNYGTPAGYAEGWRNTDFAENIVTIQNGFPAYTMVPWQVIGPQTNIAEPQGTNMLVNVGKSSGSWGYMDFVSQNEHHYEWIINSTLGTPVTRTGSGIWRQHNIYTGETRVTSRPAIMWTTGQYYTQQTITPTAVFQTTILTRRTNQEMRDLLEVLGRSGEVDATYLEVLPGHEGYSAVVKSKGDVNTRYWHDYKVGDTVTIQDMRLGINFQDVVSGVREVIDASGYSVDLELGTLGATVEQRLSRVI